MRRLMVLATFLLVSCGQLPTAPVEEPKEEIQPVEALTAHYRVDVYWSFFGPAGKYRVEFFKVGDPYPTKQTFITYNGQYTVHDTWYGVLSSNYYFMRVTNEATHVAHQAPAYWLPNGSYTWRRFYW